MEAIVVSKAAFESAFNLFISKITSEELRKKVDDRGLDRAMDSVSRHVVYHIHELKRTLENS